MKLTHTLLFALTLTACTAQADGGVDPSSQSRGAEAPVLKQESNASGEAAFAAAQGQAQPLLPPAPPTPYEAKREPTFHFEPGGPIADADLGNYYVEIQATIDGKDVGTMTFEMWPQFAPQTVRNFLRYCDEGFYDGLTWHRIVREFMLQGGDPTGSGAGDGPHGNLKGEFSNNPDRAHGYGVLSMARSGPPDSGSCQFFLCCAETGSVWNLDNSYASFGKLTSGVATLEALASTETVPDGRENSRPRVKVTMKSVKVIEGPAPKGEAIERPQPDFGDEAAKVEIQHILVSFTGANPRIQATRSKEDAEKLAAELVTRAENGEDFTALVKEFTSDPVRPGDPEPGVYRLMNDGAFDTSSERAMYAATKEWEKNQKQFQAELAAGTITSEELNKKVDALRARLTASLPPQFMPRGQMVSGFSDTA
ncbi:MAG: peptidylprolyl isomerase, partial [Planctomycetes bacterium]|nr:peptidylprolyl isomerase [Planctomycetota bacterium]